MNDVCEMAKGGGDGAERKSRRQQTGECNNVIMVGPTKHTHTKSVVKSISVSLSVYVVVQCI